MDLKGSIIDANIRVYPSEKLTKYLKTISSLENAPGNLLQFVDDKPSETEVKLNERGFKTLSVHLNNNDIENLKKVKRHMKNCNIEDKKDKENEVPGIVDKTEVSDININDDINEAKNVENQDSKVQDNSLKKQFINEAKEKGDGDYKKTTDPKKHSEEEDCHKDSPYLTTVSLEWLYTHLKQERDQGKQNIPYLHELLELSQVGTPENQMIKRNPVLEARCVKLRAQQEAREYRHMTRGVDNVRIRFPEDSISYQLKQINRQLIAVGQFIISIFAGFLFGFRGVEWMVGNLDFGFRLLLGVMCALVIALAEIYFLAKKLNEELSVPETIQLGGPPKFVDEKKYNNYISESSVKKDHQD